jgi:GDPmannose 4,6-dehydratase
MKKKKAIISGAKGQDAFYLSKILLDKGYKVIGLARKTTSMLWGNSKEVDKRMKQVECDITNYGQVYSIIAKEKPDEFYHLASQSFVGTSFRDPFETINTNIMGTLNVLESIRHASPKTKLYFAGSSEQFGKVLEVPQKETTPFNPRSPYAVTKIAGYWLCKNYRESYGLFICSGLLFNHESDHRGIEFVTKKITNAAVKIKLGKQNCLEVGNINAKRDWGYSKDYCLAMWKMLQQKKPEDYVIATGENHTVREFIELAFKYAGMNIVWKGKGIKEVGLVDGKVRVKINPQFYRPAEVEVLIGNYSKAKRKLKWKPQTSFRELVKLMVESDLKELKGGDKNE